MRGRWKIREKFHNSCLICLERIMTTDPIPDNCLPFDGDEQKLLDFLRGPRLDADGKLASGGVLDGMTPDEVIADRDAFRRACGE